MKFKTQFNNDSSNYISDPGSPYLDQYEYDVDKKGVQSLVKIDKQKDVHSEIQADYASTDINLLMKRFALGDSSAIDVTTGFYVDVTKMPKNLAELFDRNTECSQFFDSLPVEVKEMFDNSYTQFFTELNDDSKSFNDKISKYNDQFINHQYDIDDVVEKDGDVDES